MLGDDWALAHLEQAISTGGSPIIGSFVVERLTAIVGEYPAPVLRVLAAMLRRLHNEWDYISWRDEAAEILRSTAGSNEGVQDTRLEIIDFFVLRGEQEFRGFV